ncbi:MAG TPA: response regulator [Bacteroidales bacterium]|jgi:CheY-like chemotaxis protein|nr:response regulator [Bacteroidales bacterium]
MNLYKSVIEKHTVNDLNHNYKVLVVEDDDIAFFLLHEILASYPIKLYRAYNGQEAIDLFKKDKSAFDLILMDIRLPKVNGYDATQKIKEINPSIPIVAITAYAHSQGIIDCFDAGCDDFIAKPFEISKIVKIVEHYLVLRN